MPPSLVADARASSKRERRSPLPSFALLAMVFATNPHIALAHGPPPAIIAIHGFDSTSGLPASILTSKGIVIRRPESGDYEFLCPMRWGGPETPLSFYTPDTLTLFTLNDTRRYDIPSRTTTTLTDALRLAVVRAAAVGPDDDTLRVLRSQPDAPPSLWLIPHLGAPTQTSTSLDAEWTALGLSTDALMLAATDATQLHTEQRGADGEPTLTTRSQPIDDALNTFPFFLNRPDGSPPWLMLRASGDHRVATLSTEGTLTLHARSQSAVDGFLPLEDNTALLLTDGVLMRADSAEAPLALLLEAPPERTFTCLERHQTETFICTDREIYLLDLTDPSTPVLGERHFAFEDVRRPYLDDLELDDADLCISEWLDLATEAGLDLQTPEDKADNIAEPAPDGDDSMPSGGCCTVAPTRPAQNSSPTTPLILAAALTLVVGGARRSRRERRGQRSWL